MANLVGSRLVVTFYVGVDDKGKSIFTTRSFTNINIMATDTQLKATAEALASLQQYSLEGVSRHNEYDLIA